MRKPRNERDEWINEHYDATTDDFDKKMPEEFKTDSDSWNDDTPSDTFLERIFKDD